MTDELLMQSMIPSSDPLHITCFSNIGSDIELVILPNNSVVFGVDLLVVSKPVMIK